MSTWSGKFVIGLTGNIATGKSIVRKMLEHLGAYGIDADYLSNRAIAKASPGYKPVVDTFGRWILDPEGQIDRAKLGRLVFSEPEALRLLEKIVHPLVNEAVDILVRRSKHQVVIIEAIKLFESGLAVACDTVWVASSSAEMQLQRLMINRGMNETEALQRMNSQTDQEQKILRADVVINNYGTLRDIWDQVEEAWKRKIPSAFVEETPSDTIPVSRKATIHRARPGDAVAIAELLSKSRMEIIKPDDVLASFGDKAYLIYQVEGSSLGMISWNVEDLVARIDDIYIDESVTFPDVVGSLLEEVEVISRELQCEVCLIFLQDQFSAQEEVFRSLGYIPKTIQELGVRAWKDAARESMTAGSTLLFKQLRKNRVLKPV